MKKPIIIKYPFSRDGALNRAFTAPEILHEMTRDLLADCVDDWHDLPILRQKPSTRLYKKMHNYSAVKEAVTKLGIQIGRAQLERHKTLTLGGGHTQGIATIKVTVLITLVNAIMNRTIAVSNSAPLEDLKVAARGKNILRLSEIISRFVQKKWINPKDLAEFLNSFAVIWLDSHPDYNDRHSSISGHIHGMALAACAGRDIAGIEKLFAGEYLALNPKNFYILCARDIDPKEYTLMDQDGVQYKNWEMTKPGKIRSFSDADHPNSLKIALDAVLRKIGKKKIIFSMDIDAIHAGLHKSQYGLESVAATGTPMGLSQKDIRRLFGKHSSLHADELIRLNAQKSSPAGPTAGDVYEAIQGILARPNVLAADLSELSPAAGDSGHPLPEAERGLTLKTAMKVLAAILGADLRSFSKALEKKNKKLAALVAQTVKNEENMHSWGDEAL